MSTERPPRLALVIGIVATVVGLLCGVGFGALGVSRALGPIADATEEITDGYPIPGDHDYRGEGLAAIVTRSPSSAAFTCDVTDQDGFLVKTEQSAFGSSGTNSKGHEFVMQGAFQAVAGKTYTVRCAGEDVGATFEIALIPSSAVMALFLAVVGGLILAFGLAMMFIAFFRRRAWRRNHGPTSPPPGPSSGTFGSGTPSSPAASDPWAPPPSQPYSPGRSADGAPGPLPGRPPPGGSPLPQRPQEVPGPGQLPQRYPQRPTEDQ